MIIKNVIDNDNVVIASYSRIVATILFPYTSSEPLQRQFFPCFEINYSVTKCVFYFYVSIFWDFMWIQSNKLAWLIMLQRLKGTILSDMEASHFIAEKI